MLARVRRAHAVCDRGSGEIFALVKANQADHQVATKRRVPGVSSSGYYAGLRRGTSVRTRRDGERVAGKRVARLMRAHGLRGVSRRSPRAVHIDRVRPAPATPA
ncbi:MAG: transposase [Gammaproteobacteria bacterium]|nr:transposase [Gammaproteobacteria bacterium]